MSKKKQKLELTWIGKEKRPRLEPRILVEDKELSYSAEAPEPKETADLFADKKSEQSKPFDDNVLIHGDNLLALKALEHKYAGKIKCVFIDPPYNTGSAFTHYDDGVEHSIWLTLMRDRLEVIKKLMSEDGSLWITIDDNECHYLKVLCDEVFGRENFISNVIWQKRTSRENRAAIGSSHDHILIYAKTGAVEWKNHRNLLPANSAGFSNPDNDPKGEWRSIPFSAQGWRPNQMYKIETPTGLMLDPPKGRCWGATEEVYNKHLKNGRVYFPKKGEGRPRIKTYMGEEKGLVPNSIFLASEGGTTQSAKKEILVLFPDAEIFTTPKPEQLLQLILSIATNQGDLILDSFAGSGTTGAVAHKMGRRWIMVELGEHCETHIVPRLKKVIDGDDQGGISKAVNWRGGGGFHYYHMAESLLKKDKWDNWVINSKYNPEMLSEAMCKHMGYIYAPSKENFWEHGHSTEKNYIYVTTGTLSNEQLQLISSEVGNKGTLLICCKGFVAKNNEFSNLNLKKIPQAVLHKCEWDQDDYSFNINVLPDEDGDNDDVGNTDT